MKNRIIGLDIIRCTAIISVFWYHGSLLFPNELESILKTPLILPFEGVSTFFVLSGFLIGNIFLKNFMTSSFSFSTLFNFWKRRWWRTLPSYFFILIVLIFLQFKMWNYNWSFFLFSQKLLLGSSPNFFAVAWSLAVEEWFYFLFPLIVYIFYRIINKKTTSFLIVTLLFLIVPLLFRLIYHSQGIEFWKFRHLALFRLDGIMYGVLAGFCYYSYPKLWDKIKTKALYYGIIWVTIFTTFDVVQLNSDYLESLRFSIEALSVIFFLPALNSLKSIRNKHLTKGIVFVSQTSYSFYLIHANLVLWILIPFLENKNYLSGLRFELQRITLFAI